MLTASHPGDAADDITYTYDYNTNQLSNSTKEGVVKSYKFDQNNNRTMETVAIDGLTFQTQFIYDGLDQLQSIIYPNNSTIQGTWFNQSNQVNYAPDAFSHPTYVQDISNYLLSSASYYPNGIFSQFNYQNGVTATMTLNNAQWPQELKVIGNTPVIPVVTGNIDGVVPAPGSGNYNLDG